jgi:hypothetical protein
MPDKFNIGASFKLAGKDLAKFENFLAFRWKGAMETEVDKATGRGAKYIQSQIRARILDKQYVPNTLWTAKQKGYNTPDEAIPLVDTGSLIREALQAQRNRPMVWEVGIIKDIPSKRTGAPASKYVQALHDGVTVTVSIRGVRRTFRIPPRPFLRNVWEDLMVQGRVHKEWSDAIEKVLKEYGQL